MNDRQWLEVAGEALLRAAAKKNKPARARKLRVVRLPDDPKISRKQKGTHSLADRQPIRGDRIGESEDAIWLNVGRIIDSPDARRKAGL